MKAIVITNCKECPYSHDWSSAGIDCEKITPMRLIAMSNEDRKKAGETTPKWCPLPNVDYAEKK